MSRMAVHSVSPITHLPLQSNFLAPNPGLKAAIFEEVGGKNLTGL